MFDICLITPGYLVSSPRVVRAANALTAAGWSVAVVSSRGALTDLNAFDDELVQKVPWKSFRIQLGGGPKRSAIHPCVRIETWIARRISHARLPSRRWAAASSCAGYARLCTTLKSVPARLFIGHTLAGMNLAEHVAAQAHVPFALDIEDLHAEDVHPEYPEAYSRKWRADLVQRHVLPRARWLTAASHGIAKRIAENYRVSQPIPIHNVPEWTGPVQQVREPLNSRPISLVWFSQTIGPDRGLETLCAALRKIELPVHLHLRGSHQTDYISQLNHLIAPAAGRIRLIVQSQIQPDRLIPWLAKHDVGLALEPATTENRRRTVSNKLFSYLHAGLAVLASDTPGQTAIQRTSPDAIRLFSDDDADALANALMPWLQNRDSLAHAQAAALAAARDCWNYQLESRPLLRAVSEILSAPCASS